MKPKRRPKNTGESSLALQTPKAWDGKDRPEAWVGRVYGLVVHTTGRGLPTKAAEQGQYPTERAVNYYSKSHGCHYVNGYRGHDGGDLIQMANEREQANGVGVSTKIKSGPSKGKSQMSSVRSGNWEKDLPKHVVKRWKQRWPGYANPLDLLPGTKYANPAYIHVECIPLIPHFIDDSSSSQYRIEPLAKKVLFTFDQHDTVAALACDIAERNRWPDEWWRTPRLVGHEDLTPLSRHNSKGAWDPGHLRASPWFCWYTVMECIMSRLGIHSYSDDELYKLPRPDGQPPGRYSKY